MPQRLKLNHLLASLLSVQGAWSTPMSPCEPHRLNPPAHERGRLGGVASEADICSQVGADLLKAGGNAADAMVGTVVCVGVVGMYHSGFGGGGFMLIRSPNGTYEAIDFRETAPQAAFEDMYKNNEQASLTGGLASGVPGELRGLQYLHENYGKLSWADVLAPGAKLAREGWLVNEDLVKYMKSATNNVPESNTTNFLVHDPQWAMDFAPKGRLLKINETITRKRYAATIETIAQHGPDAFYTGPIADATIRALRAKNGTMTMDDLKNYTIARRPAASITYGDFKLSSVPAPSSGNVMLAVLKTMSGYAAHEAGVNTTTHRLDEAMRFAYGQRSKLGDPSFVEGLDTFQEQMLSDETAAEIRGKISDTKAYEVPYYQPEGLESLDTPGTSHISTADKDGLAVSLTTTVNLLFGSKLVVPETGVIMNNEMNDFSIPNTTNAFGYVPSPANFIRPGKRPLSSISPLIIEFLPNAPNHNPKQPFFVSVGAAGGSRIITSVIQTALHLIDPVDGSRPRTLKEAIAAPRLHEQLVPSQTSFEYGYDNTTTAFFEEVGHNVTWVAEGQSAVQGVRWDGKGRGRFEAVGETRQVNSGGVVV